jgi:FAD/FMN-containing dehydrogenase
MWERRESAAEVTLATTPALMGDIALPVDRLSDFFTAMRDRLSKIEPKAQDTCVAHLGDGNIHYVAYSEANDPDLKVRLSEAMEGLVADMRGSFSAEHGVGLYKLGSMERHKNPVALDVMRSIKTALDPKGILNPGKVIPA